MDFKNKRKASRLRATSRWFGYGGFVVAIGLLAAWYFLDVKEEIMDAIQGIVDQITAANFAEISIYVLAAAGVLVLGILFGIIFRVAAHKAAIRGRNLIPTDSLPRNWRKIVDGLQKDISKKANKYTKNLGK